MRKRGDLSRGKTFEFLFKAGLDVGADAECPVAEGVERDIGFGGELLAGGDLAAGFDGVVTLDEISLGRGELVEALFEECVGLLQLLLLLMLLGEGLVVVLEGFEHLRGGVAVAPLLVKEETGDAGGELFRLADGFILTGGGGDAAGEAVEDFVGESVGAVGVVPLEETAEAVAECGVLECGEVRIGVEGCEEGVEGGAVERPSLAGRRGAGGLGRWIERVGECVFQRASEYSF